MKKLRWPELYNREMGIWWNVRNHWDNLTHPFRKVFWWVVKVSQYSVVLWKDFDWDHVYFFILMQYKMKRMRERILANNMIVRAEEVGAQIKHAEDLIQKWIDDDFCAELHDAHEKKWGKIQDLSKPIVRGGQTFYEWDMSRENATTEELKKQEADEQREIYNKHEEARQKCLDDIFAHIRKHVQEWWD